MSDIKKIRHLIDEIDDSIIQLLASRKKLVEQIGHIKKEHNIAVLDSKREESLKKRLKQIAKEKGLDEALVDELFSTILKHSKEVQHDS